MICERCGIDDMIHEKIKYDNVEMVRALGQIESAAGYMPDLKPTPEELARKIAGLRSAFGQMLQQSAPRTIFVAEPPAETTTFGRVIEAVRDVPDADRVRVMRAVAAYFEIEGEMG